MESIESSEFLGKYSRFQNTILRREHSVVLELQCIPNLSSTPYETMERILRS